MNEPTLSELQARRSALENEAASLLGHMLFQFSWLDINLGLCLVWIDCGARIDSLTKTVETMTLNSKLDELSKHVARKFPAGSKQRLGYEAWIARAHAIRQQRNNLVHGRWGIEPHKNKVVNVVGMPTSNAQTVTEYSIAELAAVNHELRDLQQELATLREHWPL